MASRAFVFVGPNPTAPATTDAKPSKMRLTIDCMNKT